jgi:hypothetical protein
MLRADVVLSGKAGADHIFGESFRISEGVSCAGWHVIGIQRFIASGSATAHDKPLPVIFDRMLTNNRPVLGPGS